MSASLEASKNSMTELSQVIHKKNLSPDERANLWNKFRETLTFVAVAGQYANSAPNEADKAKYKKNVDSLLKEVQKQQVEVVNNLPPKDRKSGEVQFNKITAEFVRPSLQGKIKLGTPLPEFALAETLAASVAANKPTASASAAGSSTGVATTQAAGIREGKPKSPLATMDGLADIVEQGVHSTYETSAPTYAPPASTDKFAQMAPASTKKTEVTASTEPAAKHTTTTASKPVATSPAGAGAKPAGTSPAAPSTAKPATTAAPPSTAKPPASSAPAPEPKVAKASSTEPEAPASSAAATAAPKKNPREGSGKIKPLKAPAEASTDGDLYRCMHSGFVIKGDKCMAPRTLPFDLAGIDKTKFECATGTVMCNPFIFGVESEGCDWVKAAETKTLDACWKNAKPVCGAPGSRSTANCASNSKRSIESAVQLIHANHKAFSLFGAQMKRLCNLKDPNPPIDFKKSRARPEKVLADIRRTCKTAKIASDAVLKRFNMRYSTAKVTPETASYLKENGFDVPADEIDNSGKGKKVGEAEAAAAAASGTGAH
jgi:hypothetical protein